MGFGCLTTIASMGALIGGVALLACLFTGDFNDVGQALLMFGGSAAVLLWCMLYASEKAKELEKFRGAAIDKLKQITGENFSYGDLSLSNDGKRFFQIKEFSNSVVVGIVDDAGHITQREVRITDVISAELVDNGLAVLGNTGAGAIGGAAVGGLLFGGAGAVVGAIAGSSSTKVADVSLRLLIDDVNNPLILFNFLTDKEVLSGSQGHAVARKEATRWLSKVQVMMHRSKKTHAAAMT